MHERTLFRAPSSLLRLALASALATVPSAWAGGGHESDHHHDGRAQPAPIGHAGKPAEVSRTAEMRKMMGAAGDRHGAMSGHGADGHHGGEEHHGSGRRGHSAQHGGGHHDAANMVMLEPGEATELVWTFPSGGSIEYACNIPGHYQSGMVGDVEIED